MSVTSKLLSENRVIVEGVSWETYESLLREGQYVSRTRSAALPMMTVTRVKELMAASRDMKRPDWLREARQQIQSLIRP